jgi:N6-adenosine-specific RNA methylase IME4
VLFDVQYWDPPWEFQNEKTGGNFQSGASQKYPTLPLAAIQQLPVASVATPNAVLFLWVPTRLKFSHGLTTAQAWGFPHYETTVYWQKTRLGMGFWFRNVVEELLVFTKGDVAPFRCQLPNILSPAGGCSTAKSRKNSAR